MIHHAGAKSGEGEEVGGRRLWKGGRELNAPTKPQSSSVEAPSFAGTCATARDDGIRDGVLGLRRDRCIARARQGFPGSYFSRPAGAAIGQCRREGVRKSGQWLRSSGNDGASWSQFESRSARCLSAGSSVVVYAASSSSSEASSRAGNGAVIASAVVSRAILLVAVVARAVVRAANSLGSTLTASPLPDGSTNAEKELVTALKGRLVLAVGPLFFASISQTPGAVSTPLTVVASGMAKWLELYSGVLMVRVLLSWFPNIPWERQPLQAVRDMCDPYLNLFRNIIPPLFNALDLSPMLAFMVLGVLTSILNTTAR